MNQTNAQKNYATPATHAQDNESLFSKIVADLKTKLVSRCPKVRVRFQHQSFIDANLLDDVMGKEISRTLRR